MKTRAEYNILDFLKDDSFLRSVLLLTDDDVEFWDNYVYQYRYSGGTSCLL